MLTTLLKVKADIDVLFIPYRGAAQSVIDLLGGRTQFTIDALTILDPLVREGKLRALAVARPARWPDLPEVPTFVESGFADFVYDAWTGVVAPAGTPPAIIGKLNAVINEGLRSAEMKANLGKFSAVAQPGSPQDFVAFLATELPKWAEIVKVTGTKAE